jgi:formylglycine-generating enzyme
MAPTPPKDPATSGTSAESAPPPGNLREAVGLMDQGPEALIWDSTRQAIEAAGYRLLRKPRAKQGASAVVLPSVETGSNRNVALKVITDPSKQASRNLLARELQLFGIDDLPGVVVRYFAKLVDGRHQPVLVLEWIEGQSLRELLETQDLPPERRMRLTQSLFRHLSELHRAGYYWRDLSHNNILVSPGDRLRFIDFGSAKSVHDGRLSLNTVYAGGTEDFVAPAVKRGEREADVANDLFAAASAACRTLGCRRVTTTDADNRLLLRPRKELLAEVSARRIPKDFAEIVIETLIAADGGPDKSPEALAVAERLDEWFQGRQRSSQRRQQLAGLLVVALLLLGALGFGWQLYKEEVRSGRTAASAVLAQELAGRPNLNHKALATLLSQANELSAKLNQAVNQAATARADELLAQLLAAQRQALEASHSLESAEPLRASLGEVLTHTPWERTCPTIREREGELLRRWQALGAELEGANFEAAWKGLQALQREAALLLADNTQAGRAVRSRAEYRRLERGLCDRLRALRQFQDIATRALEADRLLMLGQFDDSRGPGAVTEFAQAFAQLQLLLKLETPDETRLRLSLDETAVVTLEARVATLELESARLSAERDEAQQLRARLEAERTPLQIAHDQLSTDLSASRSAATELANQLATSQARIEELTRGEADLNAALAQARADLLAGTERVQVLETELANLRATGVLAAGPSVLAKGASTGPATFVNSIGVRLIRVEPGTFLMGSPQSELGRFHDEPAHTVHLTQPFLIGETEVTQGQWKAVMRTEPWKGQDYVQAGDAIAASYINYEDALELCRRLNDQERTAGRLPVGWEYGLPTEAQWEYACRAGTTRPYCSGSSEADLGRVAIFASSRSGDHAHEVKSKEPNAWGLFDMHGNVWEWTRDAWSDGGGFRDGQTDPFVDGASSDLRVVRGGSWEGVPRWCRSAIRNGGHPWNRVVALGFRLCLLPGPGALPEAR